MACCFFAAILLENMSFHLLYMGWIIACVVVCAYWMYHTHTCSTTASLWIISHLVCTYTTASLTASNMTYLWHRWHRSIGIGKYFFTWHQYHSSYNEGLLWSAGSHMQLCVTHDPSRVEKVQQTERNNPQWCQWYVPIITTELLHLPR